MPHGKGGVGTIADQEEVVEEVVEVEDEDEADS